MFVIKGRTRRKATSSAWLCKRACAARNSPSTSASPAIIAPSEGVRRCIAALTNVWLAKRPRGRATPSSFEASARESTNSSAGLNECPYSDATCRARMGGRIEFSTSHVIR
eukprot:6183887-Pyramimonas_sp.AAC.1